MGSAKRPEQEWYVEPSHKLQIVYAAHTLSCVHKYSVKCIMCLLAVTIATTSFKGGASKGKTSALVDIVAADGMEWIRVSTMSEKRLLFDLAKMGWQNDSDTDSEMEDAAPANWEDEDDDDQVEIVKSARELARASRANPMRGHAPKVRYVLTRLVSGRLKEVDMILDKMRAVGIILECANDISGTPSVEEALPNLLVDRSRTLSKTLNIDCTILLALISDISHGECEILDW